MRNNKCLPAILSFRIHYLSYASNSDELISYIEHYLNLGDVSAEVMGLGHSISPQLSESDQNISRYEIIWDITLWDMFYDFNLLLIPVWNGNGCDDCEKFSTSQDYIHFSVNISTETLQNMSF